MDKKNTMKEQMAARATEGGSRGGVGRAGEEEVMDKKNTMKEQMARESSRRRQPRRCRPSRRGGGQDKNTMKEQMAREATRGDARRCRPSRPVVRLSMRSIWWVSRLREKVIKSWRPTCLGRNRSGALQRTRAMRYP